MSMPTPLQAILDENNGVLTTANANAAGFSNERLRLLVESNALERVAHGVYIAPADLEDKMFIAQLRRSKMIYSHETALFLHDLTDRDPVQYTVTVPTGYNTATIVADGIMPFKVRRELHQLGATQMETMFGHKVTTYNLERTICDCVRSRNRMDVAVVADAIRRYVLRRDKDLNALMAMAEQFRVTKPLRSYMEVLL